MNFSAFCQYLEIPTLFENKIFVQSLYYKYLIRNVNKAGFVEVDNFYRCSKSTLFSISLKKQNSVGRSILLRNFIFKSPSICTSDSFEFILPHGVIKKVNYDSLNSFISKVNPILGKIRGERKKIVYKLQPAKKAVCMNTSSPVLKKSSIKKIIYKRMFYNPVITRLKMLDNIEVASELKFLLKKKKCIPIKIRYKSRLRKTLKKFVCVKISSKLKRVLSTKKIVRIKVPSPVIFVYIYKPIKHGFFVMTTSGAKGFLHKHEAKIIMNYTIKRQCKDNLALMNQICQLSQKYKFFWFPVKFRRNSKRFYRLKFANIKNPTNKPRGYSKKIKEAFYYNYNLVFRNPFGVKKKLAPPRIKLKFRKKLTQKSKKSQYKKLRNN